MVATVLLGSALVVQLRDPGAWAINPFFFLIGLTYAVSLGVIASLRFVNRWPWLTDVHFVIDAVIISAAIMLSGGVDSLFTILDMLPILAAASVQSRRDGLQLATLSSILFIGLVLLQYLYAADNIALPLNPSKTDLPPANVAQYTVALNTFGVFAVAVLSGAPARRPTDRRGCECRGTAHEIRKPLAAMSGSRQMLKQELPLSAKMRVRQPLESRALRHENAVLRHA